MPSPIVVEFQATGVRRVLESFNTVQKAQEAMERSMAIQARRHAGQAADAHVKAHERWAKQRQQIEQNSARMAGRIAAQQVREAAKAEQDKTRAADKETRRRQQLELNSARMAGRLAAQQVRDTERAESARTRVTEREARRRLQLEMNSARMAGRVAAEAAREQARKRESFARGTANVLSGGLRSGVSGALGTVASVGGSILALGGGFSTADAVQATLRAKGKAADLENQSGGVVSKDKIYDKAVEVGTSLGTSTESVIEALDAFVAKSGDVKSGFSAIRDMIELATAAGADATEVSRTAGIVHMSTGNTKDTLDIMRTILSQGRAGSVDMRDMAEYGGRIMAGANLFGDKRAAVTALGAITQQSAATGGSTSAAEATESIVKLGEDVFKHESAFKFKVRDKTGKFLKDPKEIIKGALQQTDGDTGKLRELFGERSSRAVAGYADVYNRASQEVLDKGGSKKDAQAAGIKAVEDAFKKFEEGIVTESQIRTEATKRVQEADKQLESALTQFRDAVGKQVVPELVKLVPKIREMIPVFVDLLKRTVAFAEWFAAHPLKGLGALILANVTKDIAGAAIGEAVKATIIKVMTASGFGGGGGGVPPVGGAPGRPGVLNQLASGLAPATVAAATTYATVSPMVDDVLKGQVTGQARVGQLMADARLADTQEKQDAVKKQLDTAKEGTGLMSALTAAGSFSGVGLIDMFAKKLEGQSTNLENVFKNIQISLSADAIEKVANAVKTGAADGVAKGAGGGGRAAPGAPQSGVSMAHPARGGAR